jgi:5-hydroxyisourate hydrolase-like protein (transthyretin family)
VRPQLASIRRRGTSRVSRSLVAVALLSATTAIATASAANAAAGTSTISGTVFYDTNRNGGQDAGEAGLANQGIYLLDSSGQSQLAYTASDASGHYGFSGLAAGDYRVVYDTADWWALREAWVPTTTGSIFPRISVSLAGSAIANFGWRAISRSITYLAPISSYTGSNGLRVNSYDDVVAAKDIYDDLMSGSQIGAETPYTTVAFDYVDNFGATSTSVSGSAGSYSNYLAVSEVPYVSWLEGGDQLLYHEYGLAWSGYYAYIVQQDPDLTGYLKARGILSDSRLDSSHAWNRNELISEDYRQLFGTANAQAAPQENRDLPSAAAVMGLRDYLASTFTQPPPSTTTSSPAPPPPPPPPPPALAVAGLAVSPSPVKTSGTASFSLSAAAAVTVSIKDGKGNTVRTLLKGAAEAGGQVSTKWDRKNAAGQRVKSGTYTVTVDALDSFGQHAATSASFSVS